jgi:hypothetical protein
VFLAYIFTRDDPVTLANIRRNGFEDNTHVSNTVETAIDHFNKPGMVRRGASLFSIPEHNNSLMEPVIYHSMGWIVAVVEKPSQDPEYIRFPDGSKCIEAASHILPLVSFPSSERESDFVQKRALGRLEQLCEDFFVTNAKCDNGDDAVTQSWPRLWTESSSKKAKASPTNGIEPATASYFDEEDDLLWAITQSERLHSSPLSSNQMTPQATLAQEEESDESLLPYALLDFSFGADDVHHEEGIHRNRNDAPSASVMEILDSVLLGLPVRILQGSFKDHAGTVVREDDTHVHVQVETIQSHPTVLVIRDRVELLHKG